MQESKPPAPQRLAKIEQWLGDAQRAVHAQGGLLKEAEHVLLLAETQLRGAELERDTHVPIRQQIDDAVAADRQEAAVRAAAVSQKCALPCCA